MFCMWPILVKRHLENGGNRRVAVMAVAAVVAVSGLADRDGRNDASGSDEWLLLYRKIR